VITIVVLGSGVYLWLRRRGSVTNSQGIALSVAPTDARS